MKVRFLRSSEEDLVKKMMREIFPGANIYLADNDELLVAEDSGQIIGFIHFSVEPNRIVLKGFGVTEEKRHIGVGSNLLDRLMKIASANDFDVYLKVKCLNPAVNLYNKFGFVFSKHQSGILLLVRKACN